MTAPQLLGNASPWSDGSFLKMDANADEVVDADGNDGKSSRSSKDERENETRRFN
jgi:hypothetical protein